jgi:hypothetical protein
MKTHEILHADQSPEADDVFYIANLLPRTTADDGLGQSSWNARQDVRVKGHVTDGNRMNPANTAVVGVRPSPRVIAGRLSPDDPRPVFECISLTSP